MLIKIGYNIALKFAFPTAVIHLLHVHPSRRSHLVEPERFEADPDLPVEEYYDRFCNHRGRIDAPAGTLRLFSEAVIHDSGELDAYAPDAAQWELSEIPTPFLGIPLTQPIL
jgi:hypothetical protein